MVVTGLENNNNSNANPSAVNSNNKGRTSWNIKTPTLAKNTINRIRIIVESLKISPNPAKPMIPLTIGDPTTFGNLKAADETMKAVLHAIESGKFNGYAHTQGHESARKAVAKYCAHQSSEEIKPENICLTSGCSSALEYSILALAEKGQNILIPRPGFCLYQTLTEGMGIEVRYYDLLPEKQWEADLKQMESLIDENTAALIINNPSNPCGSVFSREHLEDILAICEKYYVPIIADEVYEHFVFPGAKHYAVSALSKNVPVFSCGGLTKRFLVPGWRTGWVIIHDRENRLAEATRGLKNMCGRILGSNTLVQGALPAILENTPQSFFDSVIDILSENANLAWSMLKKIRGLNPVMPTGAMYMMVGINIEQFPEFADDTQFVQELVNQQSVFCLPGSCFELPNFVRLVLTIPKAMIEEACSRIAEFCEAHYKVDNSIIETNLLDEISY